MLCRVPWYLLPGLPRPTTSFIVAKAAAPGKFLLGRLGSSGDRGPGRQDQLIRYIASFSFSLRSGLMTSGCVAASRRPLRSRSSCGPAHHHVDDQDVRIGVRPSRPAARSDHARGSPSIDLQVADVHLDGVGNRAGRALDTQAM